MPNEFQINARRVSLAVGFIVLLAAAVTAGVRLRTQPNRPVSAGGEGTFLMVATTFPLYDFTRVIAAGATGVQVQHLLPFNTGPHDFAPTAETAALVANAQLIIKNGLGLDAFADKLLSESKATVVDTSLGVPTLPASADRDSAPDPHIWLNPQNAIIQVQHIRDALIAADPSHKAIYEQNAGQFVTRLNQLDQTFSQTLRAAPTQKFVAYHSAFKYFAKRYNLNEVAVLEPVPGREPSAQEVSNLEKSIQRARVHTIFSEPQFSPKLAETVARDLQLEVVILDPIETANEGDSYLILMQRNLVALQHGLR